eukprot:CAMPEP_0176423922 /NCGR_PEP_ID=MMETSP0127-20121128/10556_1 /TAXON_ID=938130 /ORGANISM="Platyophrya macrostoma, Strain WH" /LENGTH=885 /DNA_ID=CAMNT_0017804933 /DNA_START=40 /DNA_END=2697 /DNA_ORIENTATION=-
MEATHFLTLEQATQRASLFDNPSKTLHYEIFMKLVPGDNYSGYVKFTFQIKADKASEELFFDAAVREITKVVYNGKVLEGTEQIKPLLKNHFLYLPSGALKAGENQVEIHFNTAYAHDGYGLHSYIDTDKRQYTYSHHEPYHCNSMIPCLDQPDLRARYKVYIATPKHWEAISSAKVDTTEAGSLDVSRFLSAEEANELKVTPFEETPCFSTYILGIMAGEYHKVVNQEPTHGNIPMALYCRKSLAEHVDRQAAEIFEIIDEGVKFYEDYFKFKMPFSKYDQIFCPEYNIGAMENPGIITLNDRMVFRDNATIEQRSSRANTLTHELSHMWFGDLVTMKWWNDTWLKESFADFLSYFCLSRTKRKHLEISNPWLLFLKRKAWGYDQDQKITTHPIAADVPNTRVADIIFDGITYSKGAAMLKQLVALVGPENFGKGVQEYFEKYQWSNTELVDFINCLDKHYKPIFPNAPKDLSEWKSLFIETPGYNEISIDWTPGSSELTIKQGFTHPKFTTLRYHKVNIGFFGKDGKVLELLDHVIPNKAESSLQLPSKLADQEIAAILVNYSDEGFLKIRLDATSLAFFQSNLNKVEDALARAIIWRALWDMVRDGLFSSLDFVNLVCENIRIEPDESNLQTILANTDGAIETYTPKKLRSLPKYKLFDSIHGALLESIQAGKSNRSLILLNKLFWNVTDYTHFKVALDWFNGENAELKSLPVGKNHKWEIMEHLFRRKEVSTETKLEYLKKILEQEKDDLAAYNEKKLMAILAGEEERKKLWTKFMDPGQESVDAVTYVMQGFNGAEATTKLEYADAYYAALPEIFDKQGRKYSNQFYHNLAPGSDNLEYLISKLSEVEKKTTNERLLRLAGETKHTLGQALKAYDRCLKN